MLRSRDLVLLVSVAITLLLLSHLAQGAPAREEDDVDDSRSLGLGLDDWLHYTWLQRHPDLMDRIRRTHHIDAGLVSRHYAMADYLKARAAQKQASNPFGPGRRK